MKCVFRKHRYIEVDRYLMFTGEDRVFLECGRCGKEKEKYTLDTYNGKANAPTFSKWYKSKLSNR